MSNIVELTAGTFAGVVQAPGVTLVDFWAPWCGPCRALAPQLDKAAAQRPDVRFAKVNADTEPELTERFGVMSLPTLIIFSDGEQVGQLVGAHPAQDIVARLDALGG